MVAPKRFYSAKEPLTLELIRDRVILVLKLYDKIEPTKVGFVLGTYLEALGIFVIYMVVAANYTVFFKYRCKVVNKCSVVYLKGPT